MVGNGVSVQSGILRPLCHAVYQVSHNCNVTQRVGTHISSLAANASSNEPSNDTAGLRCQLCHFRIQIALGWTWLSRVEIL